MRLVLAVCLCVLTLYAADDPQIQTAKAAIERLRPLVASGAVAPSELQQAEDHLADLEDADLLRNDLSHQDLTESAAALMVDAARRRLDRRKKAYESASKQVEAGVASRLSLTPLLQDLDLARKECDLAETRARLIQQLTEMAEAEAAVETKPSGPLPAPHGIAERFDGNGVFTPAILARIETAFEERFGKPLPISANGETAVHRALGFDHRGRVDVAIHPDDPEGIWLRQYLAENHIPYFAFRQAVPGKATGAHIHLGPMSTRL